MQPKLRYVINMWTDTIVEKELLRFYKVQ
jgi:hypothetical protein